MNTTYYPILKAKDAEFKALREARSVVTENILPLFELPIFNPALKKYKDDPHAKATYLSEISRKIGELRPGMQTMVDSYHWKDPGEKVESGEHHMSYIFNALTSQGVKLVPVVGYDRWDDEEYRLGLKSIARVHTGRFCIRLERFAFDDASDPDHLHERLSEILNFLEIDPEKCHVILDLEDLSSMRADEILIKFNALFVQVAKYFFDTYSIAGCSLPSSIDKVIKNQDSSGTVLRREMKVWKYAREKYPDSQIFFGDYGVRGPSTGETGYGNTNAKIRYTIDDEYFILRGHVIRKPVGGYQHCDLADALVASRHYLTPGFSWGDREIERCAARAFGGGATRWITIDTSHHLAYVTAEIAEYERIRIAATVPSKERETS